MIGRIINSENWRVIYRLSRIHSPTGWLLLMMPCWVGVALSATSLKEGVLWAFVFLLGSFFLRSAGCVLNDVMDRGIDKFVTRTLNRPLAAGELSINSALFICGIWLLLALPVFFILPLTAKVISFFMAIGSVIYPLAKRFAHIPQIILGILFASGVLVGTAAILDRITYNACVLYVACVVWVIGYDTIYAMQDHEDDKKLNIHSSAVFFGSKSYDFVYAMYMVFSAILTLWGIVAGMNISFYFCVLLIYLILREQLAMLSSKEVNNDYFLIFSSNVVVGLLLVFGVVLGRVSF